MAINILGIAVVLIYLKMISGDGLYKITLPQPFCSKARENFQGRRNEERARWARFQKGTFPT